MDCIFCKIINKEISSNTIYEDDVVKVFMDANPVSDGHLLVVPKVHYTDINDIPIDVITHIQEVAKNMFKLLKDKLNIDGLTLTQNNEYGQAIKHYHLHLIPRYKDDKIDFIHSHTRSNINDVYKKISE